MPRPAPAFRLVLLRHGDAGEPLADAAHDARRRLTDRGRKQARRAGRALARLVGAPDRVHTSRLPRAVETADLALEAAGATPPRRADDRFGPDVAPARVARALATPPAAPAGRRPRATPTARGVVWVVGHEPSLSALAGHLAGIAPAALELRKGGFLVLDVLDGTLGPGGARLTALVGPDALKALR